MTETKTTGEWLAADDDPLFIYALAEDGYNAFDLRVQGRKEYRAEQLAAARLILASKRLYEALRPFVAFLKAFEARPISGLDPEQIYAIHGGKYVEGGAYLGWEHLRAARAAMAAANGGKGDR